MLRYTEKKLLKGSLQGLVSSVVKGGLVGLPNYLYTEINSTGHKHNLCYFILFFCLSDT